jgi:prepilin-type N-terminal cleavage/methylation domain-containing protein
MSIKLIQQENGFTLVEIMIALLILAGGLMATAYMQTRSVNDGTTSNRLTRRVKSAEDRIEDIYIKDIKPEDIKPGSDNPPKLDFYTYDPDGYPTDMGDGARITIQDNTSPYYDIEAQALGGKPLKNLTTIQVTLTPKGEKSVAATARRTIVLNYIRSTKYNK